MSDFLCSVHIFTGSAAYGYSISLKGVMPLECHGYKDKASQMYERAMEDVHIRIDVAKQSLEEMSILIDSLEARADEEKHRELESLIGKAIIALCGV